MAKLSPIASVRVECSSRDTGNQQYVGAHRATGPLVHGRLILAVSIYSKYLARQILGVELGLLTKTAPVD